MHGHKEWTQVQKSLDMSVRTPPDSVHHGGNTKDLSRLRQPLSTKLCQGPSVVAQWACKDRDSAWTEKDGSPLSKSGPVSATDK
jgi:hypothetical protein